tara:strand:+ start:1318 stop:1803 length:486 start_codon:yes stop_codon:yes gene_type:complete
MKNLFLVLVISLVSWSANAGFNIVEVLKCGAADNMLEATQQVDPSKGYVRVMKDSSCEDGFVFFLNGWEEGEIQESLIYWEKADEKFCIDRSVAPGIATIKNKVGLYLFVDAELISAEKITDLESPEGSSLLEFFEQEEKLFALESLGYFDLGVKYPDCKI